MSTILLLPLLTGCVLSLDGRPGANDNDTGDTGSDVCKQGLCLRGSPGGQELHVKTAQPSGDNTVNDWFYPDVTNDLSVRVEPPSRIAWSVVVGPFFGRPYQRFDMENEVELFNLDRLPSVPISEPDTRVDSDLGFVGEVAQ